MLSNVVASQLVHSDYGGVVPELASREHLRAIVPVVREAMHRAGVGYSDLDAIAVTEGPGLAGALLVGITFAKALAFGLDLPLIAVNHLEGHIHAVLMDAANSDSGDAAGILTEASPLLALVVSGGHTHLYLAAQTPERNWRYRNVGKTLDDAAGEAFDKVAKLLGLPYPGGPWMDALSTYGEPSAVPFTFAQIKTKATGKTAPKLLGERHAREEPAHAQPLAVSDLARFDLSFSGIKTAVRRYIELHGMQSSIDARATALREIGLATAKPGDPARLAQALTCFDRQTLDLIASFQSSVISSLVRTTFAAAEHFGARGVLVSGGVAANRLLRSSMSSAAQSRNLPIVFPSIALSTDNAAMIAAAGAAKLLAGDFAPETLEPTPQLRLGQSALG